MAVVGRLSSIKLIKRTPPPIQICQFSSEANARQWNARRLVYGACGLAVGGAGALLFALEQSVKAYDWPLHPPKYPWAHAKSVLSSFDAESIRRGFQVYRQVCSACHSMVFLPFRRLIDVAYTKEEMQAIAAEYQIEDGPNEKGEMFMRPGKLLDRFPKPYPNDDAAQYANNGALPPDLSLIVNGREGGEDYVFSLLTGYIDREDFPAGVMVDENAHYNPYFNGSLIAMAPPLYNNIIEYEDGTPATRSQLAKDVAQFLAWSANPDQDKRRLYAIKCTIYFAFFITCIYYVSRHKWTSLKFRTVIFNELKKGQKQS